MLYPKIKNIKKSRAMMNISIIITIFISITLMLINFSFQKKLNWSIIAILGILYVWNTVVFSLKKCINLASSVLFQTIQILIILFFIDFIFGFKKWSFFIGFPIVNIISNLIMVILTIVKYKKYVQYAIYEIIILFLSILSNFIIMVVFKDRIVLNIISLCFAILNLIIVTVLNGKALKIELQKKFHI